MSATDTSRIAVERLVDGPIIHAGLHPSIGANIQGPSLIKVPDWVADPLGRYYLYFADHKGAYIRLAYADALTGPWHIHVPGSLQLDQSHFLTAAPQLDDAQAQQVRDTFAKLGVTVLHDVVAEVTAPHIASPDVHVDEANQRIVMYYHGLEDVFHQVTRVATSTDGIHFTALPEVLGKSYWRSFKRGDTYYGLAMPGQFYRSKQPLQGYQPGPLLFNKDMRHSAVWARPDELLVFWTQVGDVPEHIKVSRIDTRGDWQTWQVSDTREVLRPEFAWEGAQAPLQPSVRSTAYGKVNQLRDPAIYVEDGQVYLLYAVAGEAGIGLARVRVD